MPVIHLEFDPESRQAALEGRSGFKLLPPGQYVLRVQSVEQKAPSGPDKSGALVAKCTILDSFNKQNINGNVTRKFWMSKKAVPIFLEPFLKAAGIPYSTPQGHISFDTDHMIGATTRATCKHNAGDTQTFEDWGDDEPVGGPTQAQAAPPQMAQQGWGQQPQPPFQAQPNFGQQPMQPQWGQPVAPPQQFAPMQQPQNFGPPPAQQQGWGQPPMQQPQQQGFAPPQPQNGNSAPPWQTR